MAKFATRGAKTPKATKRLTFTEAQALIQRLFKAKFESMGRKVALLKTEDEIEDEGYYVAVDSSTVPGGVEVVFDQASGAAMVGPFDSVDAATAAAPGAQILDAECNPVGGTAEVDSGAGAPGVTESARKQFFRDLLREAESMGLDIDTSALNGVGATDQGAGAHSEKGPGAVAFQSAADAGTQTALNTGSQDNPDTTGIAEQPGNNGMLDSNGGSDGLTEKTSAGLFAGNYVQICEKSGKKVDSGLLAKVTKTEVTMRGGDTYAIKDYNILRLA